MDRRSPAFDFEAAAALLPQPATMSSREIAELTGKEHRNVMRDIRDMLLKLHGEGGLLKFEHSYFNSQNKPQPEYLLPKRETLILVSGYSLTMRAKIIDRWTELEENQRVRFDPANLSRMDILAMAIASEQERIKLAEETGRLVRKIETDAPKLEALDRIATADGSLCITDAAKALQIPPRKLFTYLQQHHWIYRRHGTGWLGYSDKAQAGLLEHKVTTIDRPDGSAKVSEQVRITPAGLARLARAFATEVERAA